MRTIFCTALAAAALTGCATNPEPPQRTVAAQQELDRMLAGKSAGPAQSCLPTYRSQDMQVIDGNTILFRDGSNRVWRNNPAGGCSPLGRPGYAMVTRSVGTTSLCRGDIVQVVDLSQRFVAGFCSLGDFVPYTSQGRG